MERTLRQVCQDNTDTGRTDLQQEIRKYGRQDNPKDRYRTGHIVDYRTRVGRTVKEPHTRQAWIPLFFPEDTGVGDGGRKPCTLGYQIIVREGNAHSSMLQCCGLHGWTARWCIHNAVVIVGDRINRHKESGGWKGIVHLALFDAHGTGSTFETDL